MQNRITKMWNSTRAGWLPDVALLRCGSIYDPIARRKHSTVYKGRKKQSIMYFAIKSVDKRQKPRVLQEVRL